jgi:hypothetical protein
MVNKITNDPERRLTLHLGIWAMFIGFETCLLTVGAGNIDAFYPVGTVFELSVVMFLMLKEDAIDNRTAVMRGLRQKAAHSKASPGRSEGNSPD